jgi:predicted enzyme related to lactoylglutathione lyase
MMKGRAPPRAMGLRLTTIALDTNDMKRAIAFWNDALGYETSYASDTWTTLSDPAKRGLDLGLQPTTDAKSDINRVHIDLTADDVDAEVRRLEKLGATRAQWPYYAPGARYVVMRDPDGNEFCICPP